MIKRKRMKEKGKLKLSRYFAEFKEGETVAVVRELGIQPSPLKKLQGRSGKIEGTRGKSYIVNIKDFNMEKRYIIHPVHLKKLVTIGSRVKW